MNRVQAILSGEETPTVDDFIEWIEAHAFNEGAIGLSAEPPKIEEVLGWHRPQLENIGEEDLGQCHVAAMEERYAGTVCREAQAKMMGENQELLAKTGIELDHRLLEAGISPQKIDRLSAGKRPLHQKVVELYKTKNPVKKASGGVDAFLYLGPMYERKFVVYLPINASLAEACWLLRGVCMSQIEVELPDWGKVVWKYNLLAANKKTLLNKTSVELHTDEDYRTMIQETTRKDIAPPVAMLTLASTVGQFSLQAC